MDVARHDLAAFAGAAMCRKRRGWNFHSCDITHVAAVFDLVAPEHPAARGLAAGEHLDLGDVRPTPINPVPNVIVRLLRVLADRRVEDRLSLHPGDRRRHVATAANQENLMLIQEPAPGAGLVTNSAFAPDLMRAVPA